MIIGKFDRRIDLKTLSNSYDSGGFETVSTSSTVTVWANVIEEKGSEIFKSGREVGTRFATFRIRHRSGVSETTVIGYDGKDWDIENIRTVDTQTKRKDYLEIFARAHD